MMLLRSSAEIPARTLVDLAPSARCPWRTPTAMLRVIRRNGEALTLVEGDISQIRVRGSRGHRAGAVGHIAVNRAGRNGNDHRREGLHRGHASTAPSIWSIMVVVERAHLSGDLRARADQPGSWRKRNALSLRTTTVSSRVIVGIREINGHLALGGRAHAGDDHIDVAGEQRRASAPSHSVLTISRSIAKLYPR